MGQNGDHIVGYECDGIYPGYTPENWVPLGIGVCLGIGWPTGDTGQNVGNACMGIYGPPSNPPIGTLFNAATTDWARVLTCPYPNPNTPIVQQITRNVIFGLSGNAVLQW